MQTILFDLDGTLTDPKRGITRSIQYALEALGQDIPTADELTRCIGPPLLDSFERLLGDRSQAESALQLYRERFGKTGMYENEVYPDIPETLTELRRMGYRLFVATSKPTVYAVPILEHFGLSKYFDEIYGSELDGTRSDKSELLAWLQGKESLDPSTTTMVGDRRHDVIGGRDNGMATVGVLYGYGTKQEFLDAGADSFCSSPDEVLALFRL